MTSEEIKEYVTQMEELSFEMESSSEKLRTLTNAVLERISETGGFGWTNKDRAKLEIASTRIIAKNKTDRCFSGSPR